MTERTGWASCIGPSVAKLRQHSHRGFRRTAEEVAEARVEDQAVAGDACFLEGLEPLVEELARCMTRSPAHRDPHLRRRSDVRRAAECITTSLQSRRRSIASYRRRSRRTPGSSAWRAMTLRTGPRTVKSRCEDDAGKLLKRVSNPTGASGQRRCRCGSANPVRRDPSRSCPPTSHQRPCIRPSIGCTELDPVRAGHVCRARRRMPTRRWDFRLGRTAGQHRR